MLTFGFVEAYGNVNGAFGFRTLVLCGSVICVALVCLWFVNCTLFCSTCSIVLHCVALVCSYLVKKFL